VAAGVKGVEVVAEAAGVEVEAVAAVEVVVDVVGSAQAEEATRWTQSETSGARDPKRGRMSTGAESSTCTIAWRQVRRATEVGPAVS